MTEEEKLIDKLRKIEAIFSRPGSAGEKVAAELARARIIERLREFEQKDPAVEYRFTTTDEWSRRLLMALLRRYGITPYRYRGQRYSTVMARVSQRFVNETLWPEFQELQKPLRDYFNDMTTRVIAQAIHSDASEAEERDETPLLS